MRVGVAASTAALAGLLFGGPAPSLVERVPAPEPVAILPESSESLLRRIAAEASQEGDSVPFPRQLSQFARVTASPNPFKGHPRYQPHSRSGNRER